MEQTGRFRRSRREVVFGAAALACAPAAISRPGPNQASPSAMSHAVLLGDSVFDNAAYVGGAPDVVAQLRQRLPAGWRASLAAVDGAVMAGIPRQLDSIPGDATHLVISVGGNDALRSSAVLAAASRSVADSLEQLWSVRDQFAAGYRAMLDAVARRALPFAVSTIYDPRYPDPAQRRVGAAGLSVINDAIIREAASRGIPVLDLRLVCGDGSDFANPIEPSAQGGSKIAGASVSLLTEHDFTSRRSSIFAR